MEQLTLIPFKTINLYNHLGYKFSDLKNNTDYEDMCRNLFGLERPQTCDSNRGDMMKIIYNDSGEIDYKEYWDHKNCKVISENQGGRDYFIRVKYSNVYSKLWIQIAMRELDEIMKHIGNDYRIKILRYKTELKKDDFSYIDNQIDYYRRFPDRYETPIDNTESYCLKYNIDFYDFCDHLCRYNIRRYGNLLLIHDAPDYDHDNYRFNEKRPILLTPIYTNESLTYLDYIGFGGFKIVVNKFKQKKDIVCLPEMKPLIDELDIVTKLIDYQNNINGHNSSCNFLRKYDKRNYYPKKDKWSFNKFEERYLVK